MFTGIIKELGTIKEIIKEDSNLHLWIEADITAQLNIDQSVAHNGICLTVVELKGQQYKVTAIKETINKTTIKNWKKGNKINLELGMLLSERLDGHIVQGHVDQTAECISVENANGSWYFTFKHENLKGHVTIEKGSITVDGTSLTVVNSKHNEFSVAIIPYTLENTLFKSYKIGSQVNIEFDVIGKYVGKLHEINSLK